MTLALKLKKKSMLFKKLYQELSITIIIMVVIITWPSGKTLQKKLALHHSYQGLWFVKMGYVCAKFRAWCHSFQPIKEQYQCFVVICLLFSIIVDQQHKVSNSIIVQSSKQQTVTSILSWSLRYYCWLNKTMHS